LAAAEGEHHVLGLRMAADVLEGAGFDVLYLGADVPCDALLSACRAHRPAILGLSATMTLSVPTLIWELAQLELLEERPVVMVGGQGIPPAIDRVLGVTQIAQSEGVVATVEVLLEQPPAGPLVPPDLVRRIPAGPPVSFVGIGAIGTVADTLSATTLAAADAARDAARHAFAMEQLAYRDPLTELWNRRAYDDRFHRIVDEGPGELAVLMLDVDGFKAINDRYGHRAGDLGLVGVARAIIHSLRPGDFAARFGGDEFAVLLPDSTTSEAVAVADRIRQAVERDLTDPPLTISVGVAAFRDSLRSTSLAVDQALYDAKQTGRNRVTLWEP
jgi:diguanylate cyclase (GGDEF)-like protein